MKLLANRFIALAFSAFLFSPQVFAEETDTSDSSSASCEDIVQIVKSDLSIKMPVVKLGEEMYWAELEFSGDRESGDFSWILKDFGVVDNCGDIESSSIVEMEPDLDLPINLASFFKQENNTSNLSFLTAFLSFEGADENGDPVWKLSDYEFLQNVSVEDDVINSLESDSFNPEEFDFSSFDFSNLNLASFDFEQLISDLKQLMSDLQSELEAGGFDLTFNEVVDEDDVPSITIDGDTEEAMNILKDLLPLLEVELEEIQSEIENSSESGDNIENEGEIHTS